MSCDAMRDAARSVARRVAPRIGDVDDGYPQVYPPARAIQTAARAFVYTQTTNHDSS